MNIRFTHTQLGLIVLFFLFSSVLTFAQPTEKVNQRTISKIGKILDLNQIPATTFDSESGDWTWQFLFAEEEYKQKVTPNLAKELTQFNFIYNQKNRTRKGQVLNAKIPLEEEKALNIILNQLNLNIRFYNKKLDILNVNGKRFYVIYFQSETERI